MENLVIEGTKSSPRISFDAMAGILDISGESYPENAANFYTPVIDWINRFLQQKGTQPVTINITLHYFNSSSSKVLMNLFEILDNAHAHGTPITVNWRYHEENDTAIECGEEFKEEIEQLDFHMVELTDEDL
jgi:hypothetical protein